LADIAAAADGCAAVVHANDSSINLHVSFLGLNMGVNRQ